MKYASIITLFLVFASFAVALPYGENAQNKAVEKVVENRPKTETKGKSFKTFEGS